MHLYNKVTDRVRYLPKRQYPTVFCAFTNGIRGSCWLHLQTTIPDSAWYLYKRRLTDCPGHDDKRGSGDRPGRDEHQATYTAPKMVEGPDIYRLGDHPQTKISDGKVLLWADCQLYLSWKISYSYSHILSRTYEQQLQYLQTKETYEQSNGEPKERFLSAMPKCIFTLYRWNDSIVWRKGAELPVIFQINQMRKDYNKIERSNNQDPRYRTG